MLLRIFEHFFYNKQWNEPILVMLDQTLTSSQTIINDHFPKPRFSIPLRLWLNCLSRLSMVSCLSLMPFFCLSSFSMSYQYSFALLMPISLRNFMRSSFVFLFIVMSFSILKVESLILKGSSFTFSRDLDLEESLSQELAFLYALGATGCTGARLFSLIQNCKQPQYSANLTLSPLQTLLQVLGQSCTSFTQLPLPIQPIQILEARSCSSMRSLWMRALRWFLLMVCELITTEHSDEGFLPTVTSLSLKEQRQGLASELLNTLTIIDLQQQGHVKSYLFEVNELLNYVAADCTHPLPQQLVALVELGTGLGEVFGQNRPQLLGHSFEFQLSDEAEQVFLEELVIGAVLFVIDQVTLILLNGCLALWLFRLHFAVDLSEEVLDELLLQVGDFEAVAQLEQSFVELETDPAS